MKEYSVPVRNYPYRIRESGSGRPFIWLHGMFYSPEIEDIFSVFDFGMLENHFRLFRIELPGHGSSPLPECDERLTWQSIASDINEIAGQVGAKQFFIGGFSQGAGISMHVCVQNSQVGGLVLAMLPKIWSERPALRRTYRKLIAHLENGNNTSILERLFNNTRYVPDHLGWNGEISARINQLMLKPPIKAFETILKGAVLSDFPETIPLHMYNIPSMLVGWENDLNHPVSSFQIVTQALKPDESFLIETSDDFKRATERLLSLFL